MIEVDNSNHPRLSDVLRSITPTKWPCVLAMWGTNRTPITGKDEQTRLLRSTYYNRPLTFWVIDVAERPTPTGVPGFALTMLMVDSADGHILAVQDRVSRGTARINLKRIYRACLGNSAISGLNLVAPEAWRLLVDKTGTCMLLADSFENWERIVYCAKGT